MKTTAIAPLLLILISGLQAQVLPPNEEGTIYADYFNVTRANKPVQYISTGPFRDNGSGQWLVFEGLIAPQYVIYRGRDANDGWRQRGIITFVPSIQLRMFNEESFPVRPPNFNPYFELLYLLHWNEENGRKAFTYFEGQLAHLSNGQTGSFFNPDSTINLENGNFSTNYYQLGITRSQYLGGSLPGLLNGALASATFFYRNDWQIGGSPFTIEEGLRGRYGLQRFSVITQLRTRNLNWGTYSYNGQQPKKQFSYLLRLTQTYQLGGITEIDGKNRRYSIEAFLGVYPANWRMFGLMARFYHGRDYYNIRFDRKISLFQFGFLVDFDKFKPSNYRVVD